MVTAVRDLCELFRNIFDGTLGRKRIVQEFELDLVRAIETFKAKKQNGNDEELFVPNFQQVVRLPIPQQFGRKLCFTDRLAICEANFDSPKWNRSGCRAIRLNPDDCDKIGEASNEIEMADDDFRVVCKMQCRTEGGNTTIETVGLVDWNLLVLKEKDSHVVQSDDMNEVIRD
jgi:hypothetical protein